MVLARAGISQDNRPASLCPVFSLCHMEESRSKPHVRPTVPPLCSPSPHLCSRSPMGVTVQSTSQQRFFKSNLFNPHSGLSSGSALSLVKLGLSHPSWLVSVEEGLATALTCLRNKMRAYSTGLQLFYWWYNDFICVHVHGFSTFSRYNPQCSLTRCCLY